ncbi:hypothetical protein BDP81DRAFT_334889 [Colletotrichum phormii]|uniref:Uncharacterized protein n=1 Tax=Colletotrichum phormii TaxID=359342 RepID=A0AAJ0EA44_9PEZI|nr:uncharacterized protein BDP81DRAFT_334889 [Colletotrichum phormii]KAK1622307.1 hypothetical protein BDP81DRAFT_334889 [Colletotrichum phormii]
MVDTYDPRFPGRIIKQEKDNDGGASVYASTDNGFNDDQTDAGSPPAPARPILPQANSKILIDFDDDSKDLNATVVDASHTHTITSSAVTKQIESSGPGRKSLDPSSAEFTPSSTTRDHLSSKQSFSSYSDARQDDFLTMTSRLKQLEADQEVLKSENESLEYVNESLKHKVNLDEATINKLKEDIKEANLLRCRAQTYSIEQNKRCKKDQEALSKLQDDLDHTQGQLIEYKTKHAGEVASNAPLLTQIQAMQNCLLNAIERAKMYEAFMRGFLTDHPEVTESFATIGVSLDDRSLDDRGNMDSGFPTVLGINDEPLISFEDHFPALKTPDKPQNIDRANQAASPKPESPYVFKEALVTPDPPELSAKKQHPPPIQYLDNQKIETATRPDNVTGLDWSDGSDNIWDSPFQKERVLQAYQRATGSRHPSAVPGMLKYGIRYIRNETGQKLIVNDGVPDVASRTIIMTGFPDEVHVQRILEHIRGGRILKAHALPMGTSDNRLNHAYIEFTSPEDARAFYRYSLNKDREIGFTTADGNSVQVHISIANTDSFPLKDSILSMIREGSTRCLAVTGFPVMHLRTILKRAGLASTFAEVITHFVYADDGSFQISFSNIESAVLVRKCIIRSPFYSGSPEGHNVVFCPDPCDASLDDLLHIRYLPTSPSFNIDIISTENARGLQTKEEAEAEDQRYQEAWLANAHSDDPVEEAEFDAFRERQEPITWEKGANWNDAVEYMDFDPDQGKEVRHRKDPKSGAFQMWYSAGWAYTTEQSQKEWLHYNIDSTDPYTQQTADLIYQSTGLIDQRKVNAYLQSKNKKQEEKEHDANQAASRSSLMMVESMVTQTNP